MKNLLTQFWNNEDGVTAIEYALIGVGMATVLYFVIGKDDSGLRQAIKTAFSNISGTLTSAATPSS